MILPLVISPIPKVYSADFCQRMPTGEEEVASVSTVGTRCVFLDPPLGAVSDFSLVRLFLTREADAFCLGPHCVSYMH